MKGELHPTKSPGGRVIESTNNNNTNTNNTNKPRSHYEYHHHPTTTANKPRSAIAFGNTTDEAHATPHRLEIEARRGEQCGAAAL